MQPFKLIRKLFSVLKSQGTPLQIALGVCVGMVLGLTPLGWHSLLLVTVALLFNVSWGGVSLGFGAFKLVYFLVRPLTYAVGYFVLEDWGQLDGLWTQLFHLPLLAWAQLNHYLVFGGYVVSLAGAAVVFPVVVWGVRRYRARYGQRIHSEKLKAWGQTWYGKALRWAALGGEAKFERAKPRPLLLRIVRWQMLIVLPLIYGLGYVGSAYAVPFFAKLLVTQPTALVLGTQVDVAQARFEPLTGQLVFDDFSVVDPKAPAEHLLRVGQATMDIGLVGLMQRRAVINRASVASIELHVKREADGSVNLDNVGTGWDAQGYLDWLRENAGKVDWLGLLKKLWEYWQTQPPPQKPEPQPDLGGAHPLDLPFSWFALERIGAERFELTLEDEFGHGGPLPALRKAELVLENLELSPKYAKRPIVIVLSGEFVEMPGARLGLSLRFEPQGQGEFVSTFTFDVENVDLVSFSPLYEKTLPVTLRRGVMGLKASVTLAQGQLDGVAELALEGLNFNRKATHPSLFGLDGTTSEFVVQGINRFADDTPILMTFHIGGTVEAPAFDWDAAFIEVAIRGLEKQANILLQPYIQLLKQHLSQLGADPFVPELDPEEGVKTIQDLLEGLFGDKQKE